MLLDTYQYVCVGGRQKSTISCSVADMLLTVIVSLSYPEWDRQLYVICPLPLYSTRAIVSIRRGNRSSALDRHYCCCEVLLAQIKRAKWEGEKKYSVQIKKQEENDCILDIDEIAPERFTWIYYSLQNLSISSLASVSITTSQWKEEQLLSAILGNNQLQHF